MKKNNYCFTLYFLLPAFIIILVLLYLYSWLIKNVILDNRESVIRNKQLFIILISSIFFLLILFGSLTLQIVNVLLHPLPLILLFILISLYLKKYKPLYVMSVLFVICFFCFNICNPFLYGNRTLLNQKYSYLFKASNDKIWIDSMSYDYYSKVNQCLDSFQNKYVINIDFGNVLFNSKLKPYLISNVIDEESPEIYRKGLHLIKKYKKMQDKPALLFISNPVDVKYYKIIESECQVKKGRLLYSMKDPSANCFKFLKSDGSLYIYELVPI